MSVFMTILCILSYLTKTGSAISCDAPAVERGNPANITCHFDTDIGRTRTPFGIDRYHAGTPQVVLRCHWSRESKVPICTHTDGYLFDPTVTNSLTLHVTATTNDFVGPYVCRELASDETFESCNLRLKQNANDTRVTCDAPAVERGSPAYITCHFDADIGRIRKPFGIDRYVTGYPQAVLRCHWSNESEAPICSHADGYVFNLMITTTLTLSVSSTTDDFVGHYACKELTSHEKLESCRLTLKMEDDEESTGKTVAISVTASLIASVTLCAALITLRRRGHQRSIEVTEELELKILTPSSTYRTNDRFRKDGHKHERSLTAPDNTSEADPSVCERADALHGSDNHGSSVSEEHLQRFRSDQSFPQMQDCEKCCDDSTNSFSIPEYTRKYTRVHQEVYQSTPGSTPEYTRKFERKKTFYAVHP